MLVPYKSKAKVAKDCVGQTNVGGWDFTFQFANWTLPDFARTSGARSRRLLKS